MPHTRHDSAAAPVIRPIADVDSLRVRKVSPSHTILAGVGILGAVAFIVAVTGGLYGDQP